MGINIIIYFKMKFFTLIALVGLTSAIRLEQLADPAHSGEAEVKAQAAEAHVDAPAAAADKKDPADDAEGKETPEEKAAAADKANGTEEKKEEKKDEEWLVLLPLLKKPSKTTKGNLRKLKKNMTIKKFPPKMKEIRTHPLTKNLHRKLDMKRELKMPKQALKGKKIGTN